MDLRYLTRRFLLGEAFEASPSSYFQSLMETLQSMNPATEKDRRKREVALEQTNKLRREYLKLERKVEMLEEQVKTLEESKK